MRLSRGRWVEVVGACVVIFGAATSNFLISIPGLAGMLVGEIIERRDRQP